MLNPIDLYPLDAKLAFVEQDYEPWETDCPRFSVVRKVPYGEFDETRLEIVLHDELFLVAHKTPNGELIECSPQHFRTFKLAKSFAKHQATTAPTQDGRLWTVVIDGRCYVPQTVWNGYMRRELSQMAAMPPRIGRPTQKKTLH